MTQPTPAGEGKKTNTFVRALVDLVILGLMLTGAGFGGYFWGIHQQLAPVSLVAPGTPGALPPGSIQPPPADATKKGSPAVAGSNSAAGAASLPEANKAGQAKGSSVQASEPAAEAEKKHGAKKFWITSSGVDYIGYSITVKVNGTPVDSFFSPGKTIDVTHLVKAGDNTLLFDAKEMGEQYNKHTGEAKSKLTLQLVSGPHLSDSFKKSDVLVSYERAATDSEDSSDTQHFSGD
jgi:hypothetical protein